MTETVAGKSILSTDHPIAPNSMQPRPLRKGSAADIPDVENSGETPMSSHKK